MSEARRPGGTGTIVEVLDVAALRALTADWEALAAEAAEPNPFYEHWMLLPALEAYGVDRGFRCVTVWDNGKLAGLFPMRLERRWRGLPVAALRSWAHRNMLLCCTPLVRAKSAAACVRALLDSGLAPVVEFDWTAADGAFYAALTEPAYGRSTPWLVTDAYSR